MKTKRNNAPELFVIDPLPVPSKPQDRLFEAVAVACGIDWHQLTPSQRGPLNRAVKELRGVGADPDEVPSRVMALRIRWGGDIAVKPMALAANWASLGPESAFAPGTCDIDSDSIANLKAIQRVQSRAMPLPNGFTPTNGHHP